MKEEIITNIEGVISYEFNNKNLLENAFDNDCDNNKAFKLIGLNNLKSLIINILYSELSFINEDKEFIVNLDDDAYNKLSQELMSDNYINNFISINSLNRYLIVDDKKEQTNINLYYAILGAILIDSKYDNKLLSNIIIKNLDLYNRIGLLIDDDNNFIKRVSDWALKKHEIDSEYYIYNTNEYKSKGALNEDNSAFDITVELVLPGIDGVFYAKERTITRAKIKVAFAAYNYLKDNNMLVTYKDEVGEPDLEKCINQLQELNDKGYIGNIEYKINQKYNSKGEVIWKCRCVLEGDSQTFTCENISKKVAKRTTAFEMLKYVFSLEEK